MVAVDQVGVRLTSSGFMHAYCWAIQFVGAIGMGTSALVEAHMSLSFLASLCRSIRMLDILGKVLPLTWPVGILFGIWVAQETQSSWSGNLDKCMAKPDDIPLMLEEVSCLIIAGTAYLVSFMVVRSRAVGYSVQSKVWRRGRAYLLAWFVSILPDIIRVMGFRPRWFEILALSLVALNGLSNTLVYACFTRNVWQLEDSSPIQPSSKHSFSVSLGEVEWSSTMTRTSDTFFSAGPSDEEQLAGGDMVHGE